MFPLILMAIDINRVRFRPSSFFSFCHAPAAKCCSRNRRESVSNTIHNTFVGVLGSPKQLHSVGNVGARNADVLLFPHWSGKEVETHICREGLPG